MVFKITKPSYIIATKHEWNVCIFDELRTEVEGKWVLIRHPKELTLALCNEINPAYIFFPHWSALVPDEITKAFRCICFHETDLPFGRGGSPIQNLIERKHKATKICALKMTAGLDEGPIYMKSDLSLNGSAHEIYIRAAQIVKRMIIEIIDKCPSPREQKGEVVIFKRRLPGQSEITDKLDNQEDLYDLIRMLDAPSYPKAYIETGGLRLEFSNAGLKNGVLNADIRIRHSEK